MYFSFIDHPHPRIWLILESLYSSCDFFSRHPSRWTHQSFWVVLFLLWMSSSTNHRSPVIQSRSTFRLFLLADFLLIDQSMVRCFQSSRVIASSDSNISASSNRRKPSFKLIGSFFHCSWCLWAIRSARQSVRFSLFPFWLVHHRSKGQSFADQSTFSLSFVECVHRRFRDDWYFHPVESLSILSRRFASISRRTILRRSSRIFLFLAYADLIPDSNMDRRCIQSCFLRPSSSQFRRSNESETLGDMNENSSSFSFRSFSSQIQRWTVCASTLFNPSPSFWFRGILVDQSNANHSYVKPN